jgi:hypothetical protein
MMNKKAKIIRKIKKIIFSIVVLTASGLLYFIIDFDMNSEVPFYNVIRNIAIVVATLWFLLRIWKLDRHYYRWFAYFTLVISGIAIISTIYYKDFSAEIESRKHLQNKYGLKYSDMSIAETQRFYSRIFFGYHFNPRSATVKYKDVYTYLYYSPGKGWIDNYEAVKYDGKRNQEHLAELDSFVGSYVKEYQMSKNMTQYYKMEVNEEYKAIGEVKYRFINAVIIFSEDDEVTTKLFNKLDSYVREKSISCDIFVIKKRSLYEKINKLERLTPVDYEELAPEGIFGASLTEYRTIRRLIDELAYDEKILKNPESFIDKDYSYEDLFFYYDPGRKTFRVYGIMKEELYNFTSTGKKH